MSWPEKLMLVIVDDRVSCGVPTRMASVFEPLCCRMLAAILNFIASRQVESVDRAGEGLGSFLRRVQCHQRSSGKIFHAG